MVDSVSALVPHVSKGTALANVLRVSDAEVLQVPETLRAQRRPCHVCMMHIGIVYK
jgi:hypothetical protein